MSETDPDALADHLEQDADELEHHSHELGEQVQDVRQDWERKRHDESVPGAPAPPAEESGKGEAGQDESPAPESPPPSEGPSASDEAAEAGPPKSQIDDAEGGED